MRTRLIIGATLAFALAHAATAEAVITNVCNAAWRGVLTKWFGVLSGC
jgi:hypothetical protein